MAPQLVEKEVYVNMKALEEEAVVRLCEPVGARTDRKLGLINPPARRAAATAPVNTNYEQLAPTVTALRQPHHGKHTCAWRVAPSDVRRAAAMSQDARAPSREARGGTNRGQVQPARGLHALAGPPRWYRTL